MQDFHNLESYQVYACGVPIMVKAAYHDFTNQRNLPKDAFFSDVFTPSTSNP
jgi:CDP-4-dehydro-6-deoxyglucose reductase